MGKPADLKCGCSRFPVDEGRVRDQIAALLDKTGLPAPVPEKSRFLCADLCGPCLVARCFCNGPRTTQHHSDNQHRVAVAVEAVLFLNRLPVGLGNKFRAAECLHQHEQRRAREMKVRHQRVDRPKLKRRANKQIGLALPRLQFS